MKKIASLFAVLLLMITLFSGCHGSTEPTVFRVPDEFDTSRNYEIVFWAKNDTNISQVNIYKKAIADFEALYPNIKVNLRLYTNYNDIYNDVITNIATQTTPNICITYPDHIATYLSGENTVIPLENLVNHPKYGLGSSSLRFEAPTKEEILPQFLSECYVNGQLHAMPYMRSTEACYINVDYVKALGFELPEVLTWDFMWEVSEAAMKKNADGTFALNGQNVLIPFIYKSTDNMMIQMLKQKEADYSTESGDVLLFNDTTKELLYTIAEHVETRAFSTFKISSYPADYLNAGQCIFAIDSTAGATWMGSEAPLIDISEDQLVKFDIAVKEIPQFDAENPKMISQGPSMCLFNKEDPQEVLASWLFMQYLLTNDVQIAYSQTEGYVPITLKAKNSAEYTEYLSREGEDNELYYEVKLQAAKLLLANTENTFVTPVFNGSASLRDAAGMLIENVTKSMRRKETVDEAYMEKLFDDITALYRLDQITADGKTKISFGKLPTASVLLLSALGAAWLCLGGYYLADAVKKRKK